MIKSVGTIVINTTPDEVFGFLAHREHFPQWASEGMGVRVVILSEGSFGDGTLIGHTQVVSRVSHVHVNQGFETDTIGIHFPSGLLVKHMHDLFQFEPVGQGTKVTLTEHIEPTPLLKPFEHVFAKRTHQHTSSLGALKNTARTQDSGSINQARALVTPLGCLKEGKLVKSANLSGGERSETMPGKVCTQTT